MEAKDVLLIYSLTIGESQRLVSYACCVLSKQRSDREQSLEDSSERVEMV